MDAEKRRDLRVTPFSAANSYLSLLSLEGEDFLSRKEEQDCYKLVEDATSFLYTQLDYFSTHDSKNVGDELNRHMKGMFKEMKKSLKEEIGSVKKDFLD